jgi:hypothetical protein
MISLFWRTRLPVRVDREFARSALELLRKLASESPRHRQIPRIRCYFRCCGDSIAADAADAAAASLAARRGLWYAAIAPM